MIVKVIIIKIIKVFVENSSMHPARKFSQNSCKNKTLNIQSTFNKENDKTSVT